jgi:hypothetical protein
VVACDFYNAGALLALPDEELTRILMEDLLPVAVSAFGEAKLVDSYVQRFPGAVTWFSTGSYRKRPPLQTTVSNLVCAGDGVRMGEREHGAIAARGTLTVSGTVADAQKLHFGRDHLRGDLEGLLGRQKVICGPGGRQHQHEQARQQATKESLHDGAILTGARGSNLKRMD